MKVHNLVVTGSLQSGGENLTSISSSVVSTVVNVSSSVSTSIGQLSSSMASSMTSLSSSLTSSIGSLSSSMNTSMTNLSSSMVSVMATTGSNLFKGDQTISGSVIPAVNGSYDLGSPTNEFRHLYLSSASLYIDGTKVLGSTTQELQITTDAGQSFKILEAGSDTITLQAADGNITLATSGGGDVILDPTTGIIALKGTTTVYAGNKILSSDGNAIQFGNSVTMTGSLVVTGFIETQELRTTYISSSILYRSGSTKFGDELTDTHSFTGSLSVSGSISVPGSNLVSGSAQILSGTGIWSGSAQLPSGVISGSAQLPSGVVSGSAQVDVMSTTNIARLATTGSNTFSGNIRTTGLSIGVAATSNILDIRGENNTFDGTIVLGARGTIQHRDSGQTILSIANDYNDNAAKFEIRMKGNTTSDAKFTILGSGAATFTSSLTAESGYFNKPSATNGTSLIVRQTTAGGNGNQDIGLVVDIQGANDLDRIANFRYYNGSTYTSRFSVLRDGKVGVGYLTPTVALQVSGTIASGDDTGGWGRFLYDSGTVKIQAAKNGTDAIGISFSTQASGGAFAERLSVSGAGTLQVKPNTIGTSDLNDRSIVIGSRPSSSTLASLGFDTGGTYRGSFDFNSSGGELSYWNHNGTSWTERWRAPIGGGFNVYNGSITITETGVSSSSISYSSGKTQFGMDSAGTDGFYFRSYSSGGYADRFIIKSSGEVNVRGAILPTADATYNLGSTSLRWNHVYTTDLHLSNEGKQNIVDGTWGDWTLQEGEHDIFMLNNRSGEKFKIKLEKIV
jgi:hypothetical protein